MKRGAVALGALTGRIAGAIGIEGAFLSLGTGLIALGSSYLSPAGPLFVIGGMFALTGLALAIPGRH